MLAVLAVGTLSLLAGGLVWAQEVGPIMYAENGMDPVATYTAVDPEGESISWSLAEGDDMAEFTIKDGVLRFKSSPDFEMPADADSDNTYVVTIRASDGGDNTTAEKVVTVDITNVDEDGTVMLSALQPQVGVSITATLSDPDTFGDDDAKLPSITWQWYRGSTAIAGATPGAGAVMSSYTPTSGDVGSVLRAIAMYDDGEDEDKTAREDSAHAVREAPDSNIPPTFPTPAEQESTNQTRKVAENTPSGTNVGAPVEASDPDVLTYSLDGTNAASFDINRATGQLMTKAALDFEGADNPSNNEFVVGVTATDPFGAMTTAQVTIMLTDVNEDPSVSGAASIDHAENGTELDINAETNAVQAAGYTATDADAADPVADLKWTLSGADAAKFELMGSGGTRTLAFEDAPNYESPGDSGGNNVYEVTVVVTDSKGNTDEQDVTVKVTNVEEDGMVTLSTLQPRDGFPVTATLSDPDNADADSVSWQWYNANIDPNDLTANAIKDATTDTYTPVADDIGNTLTARATYTDGFGDDEDVATGLAANVVLADTRNKAPVFPDQDMEMDGLQTAQERSVVENTAANTDLTPAVAAMDEDATLTYSLGGTDAASFSIDRRTGMLSTKAELDKETKDTYTVTVTAADSLNASSTITVTIKVTDVDEMPKLEGDDPEDYAENGTGDVARFTATDPEGESITWSLDGVDRNLFMISKNGVLTFVNSPDYEATDTDNMHVVTIRASDGGDNTTTEKAVTVEVTNVDEDGTVSLSTLQPQVGVAITATLADPDGVTASTVTWRWYRGSSPITSATAGAGAVMSSYTPTTGDIGSTLRARAMYDDGEGEDKTAQENSYRSVRSVPQNNTGPVFPTPSGQADTNQTRKVAENTPAGRNLGDPVAASDPGDVLTYSLDSGNDAAAFGINRVTGQLSTEAALDFEGPPNDHEYTVTVTATDPSGGIGTVQVTITMTDVNEDPSVMGDASIDHPENGTALAATPADYTASDPDAADPVADLKWTLSGADASKFSITDTGGAMRTLSFKEAETPDYESPGDSGGNNVYEVTVVVTDSKGNSDEQDVTVKVTNVEETGTVTLSTLQPRVSFPVTATLADADNITAGSVSWQWYRGTVTLTALPEECDTTAGNSCAIKGAASDTYTPVVDDITDTLTAVAQYTDGSPNEGDAKDVVVRQAANTVLADTRNKAPVFPDLDTEMEGDQTDQERSIDENTASATSIGAFVTATDFITMDNGETSEETLTYSLGGPDADSFSIDRGTAQLSTKVALDKETKDTYVVMVTATDPSGETATVMVTIKINNEDEAPMIMRAPDANVAPEFASATTSRTVAENTVAGEDIGNPVAADDANGDALTYALSGTDAASFAIDSDTGQLMTLAALDYETKATYSVTVTASDSGGLSDPTIDVTVTVTDVNEAPVVPTVANQTATKDTAFSYTVPAFTDPEGGTITYTATLLDDSALPGWLSFNASTRELSGTPLEADTPASLTIKVSATDDGSPSASAQVTFTLTVGEEAPTTLLDRYDAGKDGWIQLEEARVAVGDYFAPPKGEKLSLADTRKVVGLYFEYKNSQ